MNIPTIYIAGPYSAPDAYQIERNIREVEELGLVVIKAGGYPVMPHANTRYFHGTASAPFFYAATLKLMTQCDGLLLAPTWKTSHGATLERDRWLEIRDSSLMLDLCGYARHPNPKTKRGGACYDEAITTWLRNRFNARAEAFK